MKIVITGATGFVGASLCRHFYHLGYQVIAIGRQNEPPPNLLRYATYIAADITKPIEHFDADTCIHAAGLASDHARYDELYQHNVAGTANVLEASKRCSQFIFVSSSSVYDFTDKPAAEEDASLLADLSDYGRTKLMAEELVKTNIPIQQQRLILRPRAIYGTGDRILLSRLLKLTRFETVFYPAHAGLKTSATHINNIAYAIELFFAQQNKPALQVYNIADDQLYSLKDITLKLLNAIHGRSLRVINVPPGMVRLLTYFNPKQVSPLALKTFTQNSLLNLDQVKQKLGYKPANNFDDSFTEISQWIASMGGKDAYLQNLRGAPWILNDEQLR